VFNAAARKHDSKPALYADLVEQANALFEGEHDYVANAANLSALLFHSLPYLNWAGFYFLKDEGLVLGPFQGKPACVRIAVGKGVCGTAARDKKSIVVPDVNAFPGHIVCDSDSKSEIVVPLIRFGKVIGVIDVDSPNLARFDDDDRRGLEALADVFLNATDIGD
jgi:L-methionine (R)-S-oxide reductase